MADKDKPSYEAKLEHALTHLKAFDAVWGDFLESDPYDHVSDHYADRDDPNLWLQVVHLKRKPGAVVPQQELALRIGDALYNIRSALDHLAYSIAFRNVGAALEEGFLSFPIHGQEASFRKTGMAAISQMPKAAREIIEELQPWKAITPEDPDAFRRNPLFILNRLCNEDKHRHNVFTGVIGSLSTAALGSQSRNVEVATSTRVEVRYGPFDDDTDVIRLRIRLLGPDPYVHVDHYIHFDPAFPNDGPADGKIVVDVFKDIFVHIREVVIPQLKDFA